MKLDMTEKILAVDVSGREWYAAWRFCRKRWECWTAEKALEELIGKTPEQALEWVNVNGSGYRWKSTDVLPSPAGGGEG